MIARLPEPNRSAIGLLKLLLAASLVLPILLFAAAAWFNYHSAIVDAQTELLRISEVAREQAAKVFDGQAQVADRVEDMVRGLDAETIIQSEKTFHEAFAAIIARMPEVQSVLLASKEGRPLVSAGTYPVPRDVNLGTRDYFRAVVDGYGKTYVSTLQVGDVNRQIFFGLSQSWKGTDGALKGVIDVAVSPNFFRDFYAVLAEEGQNGVKGKVITLLREDGQFLARYPPLPAAPPYASVSSAFFTAIHKNPSQGIFDGRSVVDPAAPARIFAYRRVQGYPLYVVAARSYASIIAGWRRGMESHLLYGIPVTLALCAASWTALVRTRREMEALAQAHREIARREHAEATLLKAQRLEAVGQMTGGVAHDFNNLLTVILGSAEVLERRADDPVRVRSLARQISLAAQQGGKVTQQLLTFSRRQLVHPETVYPNELLREVRPLLDRAASEAVSIAFDLADELRPVQLDPGHFEAAILNLVGNARDAMVSGGVIRITTRAIRLLPGDIPDLPLGEYVQIAITDQGSGMTAETAAKAFEPFFTTKEIGKGTGLGLSQVYGFAKQAGGDVRIQTTLGQGTTVELLLPSVWSAGPPAPPPPDPVADDEAAHGEVVLIVEDEPRVREVTVESLRELGYRPVTAGSAQAALALLRGDDHIDILFSDVVMPGGMSGLQLSNEAKRLRPGLRILLTSGYTAITGMDDAPEFPLLSKPYDREKLARSLRAVLHG